MPISLEGGLDAGFIGRKPDGRPFLFPASPDPGGRSTGRKRPVAHHHLRMAGPENSNRGRRGHCSVNARLVTLGTPPIPGGAREEQAHATPVGHACEDKTGADKSAETKEEGMDKMSQAYAQEHKAARRHPYLTIQCPRRPGVFFHRQLCIRPGVHSAGHTGDARPTEPRELVTCASAALPSLTDEYDGRFAFEFVMPRREFCQRQMLRTSNPGTGKLAAVAHVNNLQNFSGVQTQIECGDCDIGGKRGFCRLHVLTMPECGRK